MSDIFLNLSLIHMFKIHSKIVSMTNLYHPVDDILFWHIDVTYDQMACHMKIQRHFPVMIELACKNPQDWKYDHKEVQQGTCITCNWLIDCLSFYVLFKIVRPLTAKDCKMQASTASLKLGSLPCNSCRETCRGLTHETTKKRCLLRSAKGTWNVHVLFLSGTSRDNNPFRRLLQFLEGNFSTVKKDASSEISI